MRKLIDITFHANNEYTDSDELLRAQRVALLYADPLRRRMNVEVIKHFSNKNMRVRDREGFRFFNSRNGFFNIPFEALRHVLKQQPELVMVRGLGFPFQLMLMKLITGKKLRVLVKHHADKPAGLIRRWFQRRADKFTDLYFFSTLEDASEWLQCGIISGAHKIVTQPATFTVFDQLPRLTMKSNNDAPVFLWVGRLNANKDPMTVIRAFEMLLAHAPRARLELVYKTAELYAEIENYLQPRPGLRNAVSLLGEIDHDALPELYQRADFYISSSHREGGSVAILEAMACGCIPIVSQLPSSLSNIDGGRIGFSFPAGNAGALSTSMLAAINSDMSFLRAAIQQYFSDHYSIEAIATKMFDCCERLMQRVPE